MQIRTPFPSRTFIEHLLPLTGLTLLLFQVFYFNRPPFYDEIEYLKDVTALQVHGFSRTYLLSLAGSAGPLYSVVHYIFLPLTSLEPPAIRLVNVSFLFGVTCYSWHLLRL